MTTPYYPQANGKVDILNGSLTQALDKLTAKDHQSCAQHKLTALIVCHVQVNWEKVVSSYKNVFETYSVSNSTGPVSKLIINKYLLPHTYPKVIELWRL